MRREKQRERGDTNEFADSHVLLLSLGKMIGEEALVLQMLHDALEKSGIVLVGGNVRWMCDHHIQITTRF